MEVDPIDRLEGDTPLHKAVRFTNGLAQDELAHGSSLVELLLDAGADPRSVPCRLMSEYNPPGLADSDRIRNKTKLKAMELVDPRNKELRLIFQKAEFAQLAGDDVVNGDEDNEEAGSGSDSN